jgi:predicted AlkP superfamily phosphohydrolase/phosphomutase
MTSMNQKVLVIGLDGATFDIIDSLIKMGKLPYLNSLIKNGSKAPLKSTIMSNSFPAWVSCTTGVNPGKHSIFWSLIRRDNNSYPLRLMNSFDIKTKNLWQLLGNQGYKVGVVNVPTEYPPIKVNGFLICGALTPSNESDFTYPRELKNEIFSVVPDYKCEIDYAHMSLKVLARQIFRSIEKREKLILYLLENKAWDLFFVVFTETDLAQHKFWAGIDTKHPKNYQFKRKLGTLVYDVYERLDKTIGKIIEKISEETIIFIISDHGFGPFYQSFSLSQWLVKEKYLVLNEPLTLNWMKKLFKKKHFQKKGRAMKNFLLYLQSFLKGKMDVRSLREKNVISSEQIIKKIDWKLSKAYYTSDFGIRINLQGREPHGVVAKGFEEELLKEKIKKQLSELKYSNGQPVFETVLTKEESFSGPFVERAPDLIVPINHAQAPPLPEKWGFTLTHQTLSGTHTPTGIFIASGKEIKKGLIMKKTEIYDITPTILYIFKEPLTKEMDGKVLLDIFESEFNKDRKIIKKGSSFG